MYGNNYFNQQPRYQPTQMPMQQINTPTFIPPIVQNASPNGLLGKAVESVDVVKAMDIPLDGSISYFPLTDGSAIVSKQLQTDGTSKVIIYKPTEEEKGTCSFACACGKDAIGMGAHAGNIVREVAKVAGGSGGGKPDMSMAGGKDISKIDDALMSAKEILASMIK